MPIVRKLFLVFFLLLFTLESKAHVLHYKELNSIRFDIYRNDKNIGKHIFTFKKTGKELSVESKINFEIKKLGVVLYKYEAVGVEFFNDGKFVKFNSKTNQNGKAKYVNIELDKDKYIIDGSSHKGPVPADYMLGTWWNHSLVKSKAQISAVSGRIIKQKVTFLGKEKIKIGENIYDSLHFNFSSTDENLSKDKRLNTDVWYDEKTLNWIKASFNKKGKWEYRLVFIKLI